MQSRNTKYATTNPGFCRVSWYRQETTSLNRSLRRPLAWVKYDYLSTFSIVCTWCGELGHLVELWIGWHLGLSYCCDLLFFANRFLSVTFVRWHGGLQSCGAETLLWFYQSGSFGSLGRIFSGTQWNWLPRCSDAVPGDWPTLEHKASDPVQDDLAGAGENCSVKVLFIQLIEWPKCALLFPSKWMRFILWPCFNFAGGCLLLWGSEDESRTRSKIFSQKLWDFMTFPHFSNTIMVKASFPATTAGKIEDRFPEMFAEMHLMLSSDHVWLLTAKSSAIPKTEGTSLFQEALSLYQEALVWSWKHKQPKFQW